MLLQVSNNRNFRNTQIDSLIIVGILYQVQDNLLYSPELPSHSRVYIPIPSTFNLPFENITVKTSDGIQIHMYFIHQPKERQRNAPTIVFFHGNAGNMGHRLQNCAGLYHNLHCNVLLVEYRGYGLSEGSPSEEGLSLDARASLDYLYTRNDINQSEIIVFGRSLGMFISNKWHIINFLLIFFRWCCCN